MHQQTPSPLPPRGQSFIFHFRLKKHSHPPLKGFIDSVPIDHLVKKKYNNMATTLFSLLFFIVYEHRRKRVVDSEQQQWQLYRVGVVEVDIKIVVVVVVVVVRVLMIIHDSSVCRRRRSDGEKLVVGVFVHGVKPRRTPEPTQTDTRTHTYAN